jgi:hypothetical protein
MMDFMNSVQFGLLAVALAGVCVAVGYTVKGQARMLEIQSHMLRCLGDLTGVIVQGKVQTVPMNNWRELPPDAQLMMRNSLIEIIREMDGEMPKRH